MAKSGTGASKQLHEGSNLTRHCGLQQRLDMSPLNRITAFASHAWPWGVEIAVGCGDGSVHTFEANVRNPRCFFTCVSGTGANADSNMSLQGQGVHALSKTWPANSKPQLYACRWQASAETEGWQVDEGGSLGAAGVYARGTRKNDPVQPHRVSLNCIVIHDTPYQVQQQQQQSVRVRVCLNHHPTQPRLYSTLLCRKRAVYEPGPGLWLQLHSGSGWRQARWRPPPLRHRPLARAWEVEMTLLSKPLHP